MPTKTQTRRGRIQEPINPMFIVLDVNGGWRKSLGSDRAVICKGSQDIADALATATVHSLWISSNPSMTYELLRVMSRASAPLPDCRHRWGNLLTLKSPRPDTVPFLRGLFRNVVGETPRFKWLPDDQLCEVLAAGSDASRDLFIGGVIDTKLRLLNLVRGDFERVTVPLSIFRPSGTSKPDFQRFELDDYGHSVRFGAYEASAHFILYEADADYRRRMNAKRRVEEKGFGASLRRLRMQKGISQAGFAGLTAKTIGRIERGEVGKPHGATLKSISKTLGVAPEDIESY